MLKYKIINIKNKLLKFILLKLIFPFYYKLLTFHKPIIKNKVIEKHLDIIEMPINLAITRIMIHFIKWATSMKNSEILVLL